MTQTNNWLAQSYSVDQLLRASLAALMTLAHDSEETKKLEAAIHEFQEVVTPIEWSLEDAKKMQPDWSDKKLLNGLDLFSKHYETHDADWDYLKEMLLLTCDC